DGPEHGGRWLPRKADGVTQAAGKDAARAALEIELVDRGAALLDRHATLGDVAERTDPGIELFSIHARQQAPRPMSARLERDELSPFGGDAVRTRRIGKGHHAVGIAHVEGAFHERHAERLAQSFHEDPALFGNAVAIAIAQ